MIKGYLKYISKMIDSSSSKYDKFLLLDDLNSEPTEEAMKSFCQMHNLKNLLGNLYATETPAVPGLLM